jgi:hypothetical protein
VEQVSEPPGDNRKPTPPPRLTGNRDETREQVLSRSETTELLYLRVQCKTVAGVAEISPASHPL